MEDHSTPHLVVGLHRSALGIQYNVTDNRTVVNPTGFEYNLLTTLSTVLNFSYSLRDNNALPYGTEVNGSWIGTVGQIVNGELDFALCTMSITPERMTVIDFTSPYLMDNIAFFVKSQRMSDKKGVFFTEPFAKETWILLLVYLITYALILQVLLNPKCTLNVTTLILANILGQGYILQTSKNHRRRISIAILLVFWFFTSTIILAYYDSSLTSSASLPDPFAINSLKQLIPYFERGELKVGALPGSNYMDRVKPLLDTTQHRKIVEVGALDILTQLMLSGKVAILVAYKYLTIHLHERGLANQYHLIKEWVCYESIAMPTRKNFTYKKEFSRIINVLMATGCLEKWENDFTFDLQRSERKKRLSEKDGYSGINKTDFQSAYALCFGGLLICFLIFSAERVIKIFGEKRIPDNAVETPQAPEEQGSIIGNRPEICASQEK